MAKRPSRGRFLLLVAVQLMEIIFFNSRAQKFFESLDMAVRPRTSKTFGLLEYYGNKLGMPHSKALGGGLFELRVVGTVNIRFIYAFWEDKAWVLHGFAKKTRNTPKQDIDYAKTQLKLLLQ